MIIKRYIIYFLLFSTYGKGIVAQSYTIYGKVTDADSGDPLPFVHIIPKEKSKGTTSNFDGFYTLEVDALGDSLYTSYVGYKKNKKALKKARKQEINFQLLPISTMLNTVEVVYGEYENPAWEILRKVIKNKPKNDYTNLDAYEYESYSRTQLDMNNIDKDKIIKIGKQILAMIDSIEKIQGEEGKPIIPLFVTESYSKNYYSRRPQRKKEDIIKQRIIGQNLLDIFPFIKDILGNTYLQFNFYDNWVKIISKRLISPIADGWRGFYNYELQPEQEWIEGILCDKIYFKPKRPEDLAFIGTMWITEKEAALKQIDVKVSANININFVERLKIQASFKPVIEKKDTIWMPEKTRALVHIGLRDTTAVLPIFNKKSGAGFLIKTYSFNKNITANIKKPISFFDNTSSNPTPQKEISDLYWDKVRGIKMNSTERNIFRMIDTVQNFPTIRTFIDVLDVIVNGYLKVGKVELGPYLNIYGNNKIEGHRFQLGIRTDTIFHSKLLFNGYLAYETKNNLFKYNVGMNYIFSRKKWGVAGFQRSDDINTFMLERNPAGNDRMNDYFNNSKLFIASELLFNLNKAFHHITHQAWISYDLSAGVNQKFLFKHRVANPLFDFGYYPQNQPHTPENVRKKMTTTEVTSETTIFIGALMAYYGNRRKIIDSEKPIIHFLITRGFPDILGSQFNYYKFELTFEHLLRVGVLGKTYYLLSAGFINSRLPYPLLKNHIGNEGFFYSKNAFNMMRNSEFISDKYISLQWIHRFEGLLFNKIPFIKKFNFRAVALVNMIYGTVSKANQEESLPIQLPDGNTVLPYYTLSDVPYFEVGYGIENIFKFIRIDFLHRLNYLNNPGATPFAVKMSFQFRF